MIRALLDPALTGTDVLLVAGTAAAIVYAARKGWIR